MKHTLRKKILFSIFILLVGGVFLELAGQILIYAKSFLVEPGRHAAVIEEKGYVRMKPGFEYKDETSGHTFSINSLGFRGRKISKRKPDQYLRIVTLGGSTTFGIGSSENKYTYPSLLENKLNGNHEIPNIIFEVINAGVPGSRSINIFKLFSEQILKMDADIVLIYSGWNDWNEFFNRGPSFFEYDSIFYRLNLNLSEISVLYSKLKNVFFSYQSRIKIVDYEERALKVLNQNYFLKPYQKNIVNLFKLCQENGIRPLLLLQPPSLTNFTVLDEMKFLLKDPYFLEEVKILPIVRNKLMETQKNISQENNFPIIDINYMFDAFKNGDLLYFDTIHFNDKGNQIIAEGIANWILSDKNIPVIKNLNNRSLKLS